MQASEHERERDFLMNEISGETDDKATEYEYCDIADRVPLVCHSCHAS